MRYLVAGGAGPYVSVKGNRGLYLKALLISWLLPAIVGAFCVVGYRASLNGGAEAVNPAPFALLIGLMILLTFCMSITYWAVGGFMKVGFWLRTLSLLPVLLFLAQMFSTYAGTDPGKRVLNEEVRSHADPHAIDIGPPLMSCQSGPKPPDQPLVILACAGGGTRAALFNASVMAELYWDSVTDLGWRPPKADPLAALSEEELKLIQPDPNAKVFYPGRILLNRLDAISAVSGGGLAAAYFEESLRKLTRVPTAPQKLNEVLNARANALRSFFESDDASGGKNPLKAALYVAAQQVKNRCCANEADYSAAETYGLVSQFEASKFMNDLAQDHLGSILIGFADPWLGRGPSLEEFWTRKFGWESSTMNTFYDWERTGLVPHLILNSTDADKGSRIAITNLDERAFDPMVVYGQQPRDWLGADGQPLTSSVTYPVRYGVGGELAFASRPGYIETFSRRVPGYCLPLAQAVHANSNFPIGLPVMRFQSGTMPELQLLDGGIVDNTGMDTAMALVRTELNSHPTQKVLILEVDTSELAIDKSTPVADPLTHNLLGTMNAMWRAGQTEQAVGTLQPVDALEARSWHNQAKKGVNDADGTRIHEMLPQEGDIDPTTQRALTYVYGRSDTNFGIFYVKSGDTASDHVPTSWHLSVADRARIYRLVASPTVREPLEDASLNFLLKLAESRSLKSSGGGW